MEELIVFYSRRGSVNAGRSLCRAKRTLSAQERLAPVHTRCRSCFFAKTKDDAFGRPSPPASKSADDGAQFRVMSIWSKKTSVTQDLSFAEMAQVCESPGGRKDDAVDEIDPAEHGEPSFTAALHKD